MGEEAPEAEVELYKITGIREVTDITPEGVFIKLMEVTYETSPVLPVASGSGKKSSARLKPLNLSRKKRAK